MILFPPSCSRLVLTKAEMFCQQFVMPKQYEKICNDCLHGDESGLQSQGGLNLAILCQVAIRVNKESKL